jgi:DNA ligase 1
MKYLELAELYEEANNTTKRLEKTEILSKFLKKLEIKDSYVLYLISGNIYPEYDERKIGISNQLTIKAISKATGAGIKRIEKEWKKIGDIGQVAQLLISSKKQATLHSETLTTKKVTENLRKLTTLVGAGTVTKKISLITELLTSAKPIEALYITRTLIGDLRIGIQESTIRESLAKAFFPKKQNASEIIQRAIDKTNDLAEVFEIAKKGNLHELEKMKLEVGKPIKAMLAQKAVTIKDGLKELGTPCAIEYKYDGFRLLIHKQKEKISLFTRSLESVTNQFPEVIEYIKKYIKGDSFILDSEAVGYNKKTKKYTDFQAVSQRIRRKHHIEKLSKELPVEVNVFDILYYNGKSQLDEPFKKRSSLIRKIITNKPYKIISSKQIITSDEKKIKKFYHEALKNKQEGVMMKNLNAEYKPGRRVGHMLKIKPDTRDLDLVITGAEYGTGKRSGWLSSFILSCKNKNEYLEIGKVGTGIKEKSEEGLSFEDLTKMIKPLITKESGKKVEIKPKIVVAVHYQDIQKSPNYKSGFALRFPRFTTIRKDKPLSEINTLEEITHDFTHQKKSYMYG